MKLIMAVSADGYVARGPKDDMSWLGPHDKMAFKMLTMVGGICGVGSKTRLYMPEELPGRVLFTLSTKPVSGAMTLERFARLHPNAWLLGGQYVAMVALSQGLLDEVHLCRSERSMPDHPGDRPVRDLLTPYLRDRWDLAAKSVHLGDTRVECWRRG